MDKAEYYFMEALALHGDSACYFADMVSSEVGKNNMEKALQLHRRIYEFDSSYLSDFIICFTPPVSAVELYQNAVATLDRTERSGRLEPQYLGHIAYAFYLMGKKEEAKNLLNQSIELNLEAINFNRTTSGRKIAQYDLAAAYSFLGDKEKAYKYLKDYGKKEYFRPPEICLTRNDPLFNNIRDEERFKKIIHNMEANHQRGQAKVKKWLAETGVN